MERIKIHIFHTGEVCVAPALPFGGEHCNIVQASGLFIKKRKRIWLPVSSYLIEHPKGKVLVDCGWHRNMSPNGEFDKKAQIKSLGSRILYKINQGKIEKGAAINEQLLKIGIRPSTLDYVLLTHLDCDHVNGLNLVKEAKKILVSSDEMKCAEKYHFIRYQNSWWEGVKLIQFHWNAKEGPVKKSFDLFGDESIQLINIPGHSDGLFAVKVTGENGKFVLLYSDGGYAKKSWEEMVPSGISLDKEKQRQSLEWIREQSMNENCVESIANHDPEVIPHLILL